MKPLLLLLALPLSGCAIAALPVATQVPLWGAIAGGGAAIGTFGVNALHTCREDQGCTAVPVPP